MHPLIKDLSMFTWMDILDSKEKCISFLEDLDLVPKKTDYAPDCPKCSSAMSAVRAHYIIGWRWHCKNRLDKNNRCLGRVNPLDGTLFQGLRIPITEVVALIFGYIMKMSSVDIKEHLDSWRSRHNVKPMSLSTVLIFYKQFDELILSCLNQRSETFESGDKINREKLLMKYSKTRKVQPVFRNLTFQFLMDIKSKYPCFKRKDIPKNVNSSAASTNSTTESASAKSQLNSISSSETDSDISTIDSSVSDSNSSTPIINSSLTTVCDKNKNSESFKTPNTVLAANNIQTTNALSDKSSKSANSVPILSEVRATKTIPCKRLKTTASTATKYSKLPKNAFASPHTSKEKIVAVKISNSLKSQRDSIAEEINLIRNKLNIQVKGVVSLNSAVAPPSTVATITNLLNENSNSVYAGTSASNDCLTFPADLNMDIDHVETVNTTLNE